MPRFKQTAAIAAPTGRPVSVGSTTARPRRGAHRRRGGVLMRSILRRRLSPATVLASIALLVALGGTGVAAVEATVPNASVGTPQLKASAVTAGKIAANAVTNVKIANSAVTNAKIGTNAITNSKLAGGAVTSAKVQNSSL